jgi:peptidoglycan hydrolase-like protein with peptidoglycan-binding domain
MTPKVLAAAGAVGLALTLVPALHAATPQTAGLQVALRAWGLYLGPVDGIAGPGTRQAVRAFQRQAGLPVDGRAGEQTRRALGPLGGPLLGGRTLRRGAFGGDVAVLQFLLKRSGLFRWPIDGYFGRATATAVHRYQQARGLAVDGVAGPLTLASLRHSKRPVRAPAPPGAGPSARAVRELVDAWAGRYRVDPALARALAWMESGYQPNLSSEAGAWGVMQIIPTTWDYVEVVVLGQAVPRTVEGNVRVGVALLRHLLNRFEGDERLALGAWYQGERAVREHGLYNETTAFVANVLALRSRV